MGLLAKVFTIGLAMILLLVGCDDGGYGVDLYSEASKGRATLDAAQAGLYATQDARQQNYAQATLSAAATQGAAQGEIDLLKARLQATRDAMTMELERSRPTERARLEKAMLAVQNQAATVEAVSARATQTAIALQMDATIQDARRREQMEEIKANIMPLAWVVIFMVASVLLFYIVLESFHRRIKWRDQKESLIDRRPGTFAWVFDPNTEMTFPQLISGITPRLPARIAAEMVEFSPGGVTATAPMSDSNAMGDHTSLSHLAIRLLQDAQAVVGGDSMYIPGYRALPGWSS